MWWNLNQIGYNDTNVICYLNYYSKGAFSPFLSPPPPRYLYVIYWQPQKYQQPTTAYASAFRGQFIFLSSTFQSRFGGAKKSPILYNIDNAATFTSICIFIDEMTQCYTFKTLHLFISLNVKGKYFLQPCQKY